MAVSCAMNVSAAETVTITLTPPTTTSVAVGSTLDLMSCASVKDANSADVTTKFVKEIDYNTAEKSSISRYLKFTSSNPMVAGVNPDGTLYGLTPGTSTVTISGATVDGYNNFYTLSAAVTAVSFDVTVTGTAPTTTWKAEDAQLRYWNLTTDATSFTGNNWTSDASYYYYQKNTASPIDVLRIDANTPFLKTYSDSKTWASDLQFEKDGSGVICYNSGNGEKYMYLNSHARLIVKNLKDGEVVTVRGASYDDYSVKNNDAVSASDYMEGDTHNYSDAINLSYPYNYCNKNLFVYHKNANETSTDRTIKLSGSYDFARGRVYSVTVGYPAASGTFIASLLYEKNGIPGSFGMATYGSCDYATTLIGQQDVRAYIAIYAPCTDDDSKTHYYIVLKPVTEIPKGTGVVLVSNILDEDFDLNYGYLLYVAPGNQTTYTTVDADNKVTNYYTDENGYKTQSRYSEKEDGSGTITTTTPQNYLYCSDGTFSVTDNPMTTNGTKYYYFILAKQTTNTGNVAISGTHTIGTFQMLKPKTSVKKGKAYLKLPESIYNNMYKVTYDNQPEAKAIPFVIADSQTPTPISKVTMEKTEVEDDAYYTLAGVKVNKADKKGIYIHHHQKIVVK